METFCTYHPSVPAEFDCQECDILLCGSCIVRREINQYGTKKNIYLCPRCNQEADWIGATSLIKPFWNRFPSFFAYPFSTRPLVLNILLSIAAWIFSGPGLFGLIARFLLWAVWLKYSFEALQETAKGKLTPPALSSGTLSENFELVFKQLGLYIVLFVVFGFAASRLGLFAGTVIIVFLVAFLPAMIILLVTTGSLIQALNPFLFTRLAIRIGKGYWLLYFFLFLLLLAPGALFHFIFPFLPAAAAPMLVSFFKNVYTLISYHLMGYVLLQYHREIGYEIEFDDFSQNAPEADTAPADPKQALLAEIDMHLKDGKFDQALSRLEEDFEEDKDSWTLPVHDRYSKLLAIKKKNDGLIAHGKTYLDLLVSSGDKTRAISLFTDCMRVKPDFMPSSAALIKLGAWLKGIGQYKSAIRAYQRFIQGYPADPMAATAYFRAAEIFNENLSQPEKAARILRALLKKYPDHHMVPFVNNYMKKLSF